MTDPSIQAKAIIVQTQEEERYRLAKLLQQGPAQLLANATVEIETYLRLVDTHPHDARAGLEALLVELQSGLADVRALIEDLQPPLLGELGLGIALEKYGENFTKQTGIAVELNGWHNLTERFPAIVELAIFRIVQEALENVRAHSHANRVQVDLKHTADQFTVTIADNGQGITDHHSTTGRRLGWVAMHDRAELLDGSLQVFSEPGRGVRIVLTAPLRTPLAS